MRRVHFLALIFGVGVPVAGARADLSIEALGDPVNSSSYLQNFRVFAETFDYVAVQVSGFPGDTFEGPTAVGVTDSNTSRRRPRSTRSTAETPSTTPKALRR